MPKSLYKTHRVTKNNRIIDRDQRHLLNEKIRSIMFDVNVNKETGTFNFIPPENSKFSGSLRNYAPTNIFNGVLHKHNLYKKYYENQVNQSTTERGINTKNLCPEDYFGLVTAYDQRRKLIELEKKENRKRAKYSVKEERNCHIYQRINFNTLKDAFYWGDYDVQYARYNGIDLEPEKDLKKNVGEDQRTDFSDDATLLNKFDKLAIEKPCRKTYAANLSYSGITYTEIYKSVFDAPIE